MKSKRKSKRIELIRPDRMDSFESAAFAALTDGIAFGVFVAFVAFMAFGASAAHAKCAYTPRTGMICGNGSCGVVAQAVIVCAQIDTPNCVISEKLGQFCADDTNASCDVNDDGSIVCTTAPPACVLKD
jgi:hypothetical protein